ESGGPDGKRLFRIRLVAGPVPALTPPPAGDAAAADASRGNPAGVGGGGGGRAEGGGCYGKTYTLAATSLEDARAWASAIRSATTSGEAMQRGPED
ncbi:unnamed protein product, partial [Ectocarpus sp. 8 AP-2014]